jgi:endonuclease-8
MPEGDTIFRSARAMQKVLAGAEVTGFETGYALLARVNDDRPVVGRVVEKVEARGKWMLVHFSGDLILVTHMLMSGSWHLYRPGERWQRPRSGMRVVVRTAEWEAVGFNVPVAEFHTARSLERHRSVAKLGPDVLGAGFEAGDGVRALTEYGAANPEAEVGEVLLNQRVMAGLGNVYKSEVCFAAGVHPFRQMQTVTAQEIETLSTVAQRYMGQNVKDGAEGGIVTYTGLRRTTGSSDHGARLWVYRRRGEECRRCGATIEMRKQGVGARSTFWCPVCQPIRDRA